MNLPTRLPIVLGKIEAEVVAPSAPLIQEASNIGQTTARVNAKVVDDGGAACEGRFRYKILKTLDLQVAASLDDSHELEGTGGQFPTATGVRIYAYPDSTSRRHGGFRFVSASLPPKGSTIIAAYLEVYIDSDYDNVKADFHFEKASSPNAFTTDDYDITSRSRTTASALWDATSMGAGWKQSPSLVAPLQEIVDTYDATALVVLGVPYSDVTRYFRVYSYDYDSAYSAKLHIEWEEWVYTEWANGLNTDDPFFADLTDLDKETEYEFQAQLRNSEGESAWSDSEFFTTLAIVAKYGLDSGLGIDISELAVALTKLDAGQGTDLVTDTLLAKFGTDTGLGVDLSNLIRAFVAADSGLGVDIVIEHIIGIVNKFADDSGLGTDLSIALLASLLKSDNGTGTDIASLLVELIHSDSGTGIDLAWAEVTLAALDSGQGVDVSTLHAILTKLDAATGTDLVSEFVGVIAKYASDAGVAIDQSTLEAVLAGVDTGEGLDEATLSWVGQLLKLLLEVKTYRQLNIAVKPYRNAQVVVRPYRDLTVTTKEVKS